MNHTSEKRLTIAIDGFSSSGKSTFAKAIAARLGYVFIDTGAMYRAVTLWAIEHGVITNGILDHDRLVAALDDIEIDFRYNPVRGASDIYLDGTNVEGKIRAIEVSNAVSEVSSIGAVREKLVAQQRRIGTGGGVVMDGRDIGTVVFPDADLKIYLTAEPKVRAERRYKELREAGEEVSYDEIERNIRERDHLDQTRKISPLRKADDAVVLDNGHMTLAEQMEWVEERLAEIALKR